MSKAEFRFSRTGRDGDPRPCFAGGAEALACVFSNFEMSLAGGILQTLAAPPR
jgi:hypothetical protein